MHVKGSPDLYPSILRRRIDLFNQQLFDDVNNGPYKVLFATSPAAAVAAAGVWEARLAELDLRLATRRYLFGEHITDSDVRLFVTLASFDTGYRPSFPSTLTSAKRVSDYPHLWAYARDLFATPGFVDEREEIALGYGPRRTAATTTASASAQRFLLSTNRWRRGCTLIGASCSPAHRLPLVRVTLVSRTTGASRRTATPAQPWRRDGIVLRLQLCLRKGSWTMTDAIHEDSTAFALGRHHTGSDQVYESVLDAIGDTPLIRLTRLVEGLRPRVYAKVELTNPGGSVKDRAALSMVLEAERSGRLGPGGTIVEATSGNTGIGLAVVAAHRGYRAVFVVPDKTSPDKVAVLKAYGAEVVVTSGGLPRGHPQHIRSIAERLAAQLPGGWMADQYDNPANPYAHFVGTGPEIWRQTRGRLTHLVVGIGTGGTVSGTARFLAQASRGAVQVIGADPYSSVYGGGDGSPYAVEAIGHYRHPDTVDDTWPASYDTTAVDRLIRVTDHDSLLTTRRLAREEGLLVGPSSGTAVAAALAVARDLDDDSFVVVVLPDSGRGYLSTVHDDTWLRTRGFLPAADPSRSTVADALDELHATQWPIAATAADTTTVREAADISAEAVLVVLHRRPSDDGLLRAPAGSELLGTVRPSTLLAQLGSGALQPSMRLAEVPQEPVVTAGVGEAVDDVLGRVSGGADQLIAVLLDGRLVAAVTADRLRFTLRR